MSKRNHIVERASDVNGGQYIQTNSSYNSGYEDGKKAGKEYCAAELATLRKQIEKLTAERDALKTVPMKYRRMQFNAELQDEVTQLQKQLAALAEQNEKLTEAYDQCGRTVQDYGRTIDQTESRLREVATHCANVEQQLATLEEQNAKMRKALTKWRYLDGSYNWRCGHCGNEVEDEHKEGCALSLPDLATIILNKEEGEIK